MTMRQRKKQFWTRFFWMDGMFWTQNRKYKNFYGHKGTLPLWEQSN